MLTLLLPLLLVPATLPTPPWTSPQQAVAERGYLGIQMTLEDGWMVLSGLLEGSPAAEAGLRVGDRLRVPGRELSSPQVLADLQAGQELRVEVERDGWRKELTLVLAPRSALGEAALPAPGEASPRRLEREEVEQRVREAQEGARARIRELRERTEESEEETGRRPRRPSQPQEAPEVEIEVQVETSPDAPAREEFFIGRRERRGAPDRGPAAEGPPSRGFFFQAPQAPQVPPGDGRLERALEQMQRLGDEVRQLRNEVEELRALRGEIRRVIELLERRGGR